MERKISFFFKKNEAFHKPWIETPNSDNSFQEYLQRYDGLENISYWIMREDEILGVINLNNIILGKFRNAFLGYYGSKKSSGTGVMSQGMKLVLEQTFNQLNLHRVECAIQPHNTLSLGFARRLGFHFEGYAPKYLKIDGEWKDHLKWSLTKEQWSGDSSTSSSVELSEYNPLWAQIFKEIKQSMVEVIPQDHLIDHIGSTAIPNLAAKPIIDIQIGIKDFKNIPQLKIGLAKLNLEFKKGVDRDHVPFEELEYINQNWEKRFFCGQIKNFPVNVHVRILGSSNWRFALLFRDFLRANNKARLAYEQVKRRLSELGIARGIYSYTKDPVCDLIYLQAEEWAIKNKSHL